MVFKPHKSLLIFVAAMGLSQMEISNDDRVADPAVRRQLDQLTPNARSEAEAAAF